VWNSGKESSMKVYISADIEGVTGVTTWAEADLGNPACEPARR